MGFTRGSCWRRKVAKDFCRARGDRLPDVNGPTRVQAYCRWHHKIRVQVGWSCDVQGQVLRSVSNGKLAAMPMCPAGESHGTSRAPGRLSGVS